MLCNWRAWPLWLQRPLDATARRGLCHSLWVALQPGFPAPVLSRHCLEGGLSPAQRGLALGAPTPSGTPEPLEPWGGGAGALRWPWVLRGHCGGPGSLPSSGGLCLRHLFMLCCCRPFGLTSSSISRMKKAPTW